MLNRNVSEGYDDEVAEWLRRWTANPMGSARVGSNPILVGSFVQLLPFLLSRNSMLYQLNYTWTSAQEGGKKFSVTGNRTRACWVRASYPNH